MDLNVVDNAGDIKAIGGKVVHPKHYNRTSIECIVFARHLTFSAGNAFKYIWRMGAKDDEVVEHGKVEWYVKDVLTHQTTPTLDTEHANYLVRLLSSIADEFEPDVFVLLVALIDASIGDYEMLFAVAEERGYFEPRVIDMMQGR